MYQKTVFENGLRVITAPMPQVSSVSAAIFVGAGSRYEDKKCSGISHFLEHLTFKGSKKYPSHLDVSQTIEGLGGVTNAATDTEVTFYWVKTLKPNFKKALDVLFDIVLHPNLRPKDINKERPVIIEEINRYEDIPESRVWDVFLKTVWPTQVLGQRILGENKIIQKLKRKNFIEYREQCYVPSNMVVVAAGNIKHEEFVSFIKEYTSKFKGDKKRPLKKVVNIQNKPQSSIYFQKTQQAHLVLGVQGLNINHPDRFAISVANAYLGAGLSSKLFIKLREEKGLCYYIRSFVELYQDSGLMLVNAGLNLQNIRQAIEEILKQLKLLKKDKIQTKDLREAKNKVKGPLLFKLESTDTVVQYLGAQALLMGDILTPRQVARKVDAVTADDIIRVAEYLFVNERLNLAVIGPFKDKKKFEEVLKF